MASLTGKAQPKQETASFLQGARALLHVFQEANSSLFFWVSTLCIAALFSAGVFFYAAFKANQEKHKFEDILENIRTHTSANVTRYENILLRAQSALYATPQITRETWEKFSSPLVEANKNLPGFVGIAYVAFLSDKTLPSFVENMRSSYGNDFKILPEGNRKNYCIITFDMFLSPTKNSPIGFDVCAHKDASTSFESSLNSPLFYTSPPMILRIDLGLNTNKSVILKMPIYSSILESKKEGGNLRGWASAALRLKDFFASIEKLYPQIYFSVRKEGTSSKKTDPLFEKNPPRTEGHETRSFAIPVGSERWEFSIVNPYPSPYKTGLFYALLGCAFLLSVLLSLALFSYVSRNRHTRTAADQLSLKAHDVEKRMEKIITSTPGAFYERREAGQDLFFFGNYIYVITGYSPFELDSWDRFKQYIHAEDRQRVTDILKESLLSQLPYHVEYRFQHKEGHWIWIYDTGIIDKDQQSISGILFENTEESENRLKIADLLDALQNAAEGIVEIDSQQKIFASNQAFQTLIQKEKESLLGTSILEFIYKDDHPLLTYLLQQADKKGKSSTELRILSLAPEIHDTPLFYVNLIAIPHYGPAKNVQDIQGYHLFFYDITTRKRQESQLIRSQEEAVEANRTKTEFLSIMGHELRTPLNAIMGYSDMLIEDKTIFERAPQEISFIKQASEHLFKVVNDIIDISHLETGRASAHISTFSAEDLLDGVYKAALPLAALNKNRLMIDIECDLGNLESDAFKLRQNLMTLVRNSLHMTHDGEVYISAKVDKEDHLHFTVRDTGPGIPHDKLKHIFQPFGLHNIEENRHYNKTGVEMAVIKRFTELLHGEFMIKSSPSGNVFTLRLPRQFSQNAPDKSLKNSD